MVKKSIFYFLFLLNTLLGYSQNLSWHSIPEKQIILNELLPYIQVSHDIKINVKKFELSEDQVSLKSYKIFLASVKKDSGEVVYQSLLPDTNIGPKDVRDEYFNSGKYDNYPVVGISWENALQYCKWMTLKNNPDSIQVIYRLPNLYEYYSAYTHLQSSAINNSLNNLYADWLMDAKDESYYFYKTDQSTEISFSFYYFHSKGDMPAQKRKMVMGKSFLHSFNEFYEYTLLSFYADHGYRHIGFRMVKDTNPVSFLLDEKNGGYENPLLKYWKLKPTSK